MNDPPKTSRIRADSCSQLSSTKHSLKESMHEPPRTTATGNKNDLNSDGGQSSSNSQGQSESRSQNQNNLARYWLVSLLCIFAAMGGFMYGYDTGTISGYINMPEYIIQFGQLDKGQDIYYFSKVRDGLLVGSLSIGGLSGGILGGRAADLWGRRASIMLASSIYIVGVIIQITSFHLWYQMLIGRAIGGLGIGALAVLVPMFQSETAPQELRGALVSSFQLMITLGIFIGYLVCYQTNEYTGPESFRIPMGLCFVWATILIAGMSLMPESPRYLVSRDRLDDAKRSLCFTMQRSPGDAEIVRILGEICISIRKEESEASDARWIELITGSPRIGYRVIIGIMLQSLQQLCGANYFFYYGTSIFSSIGMSNSFATSMVFGAVNFLSTFIGLYNVERFGRRKCLLAGAILMLVFFIIYATLGTRFLYTEGLSKLSDSNVGVAMIAVTCLFILCFAATWAPITFVVVSEIYPLRIKSKGMAIATGANWFWNFMISFFTPFITGAIGYNYGYVFSGCLLFAFAFAWLFVPETRGLSLEQIDMMFISKVKPWKSSNWLATTTDLKPQGKDDERSI